MTTLLTSSSPITTDWTNGELSGEGVEESTKRLGELPGIFHDGDAWAKLDPAMEVYRVQYWQPVPEGTEGGLFWGKTVVHAGKVGDEYFMTHGHFHKTRNRAEYYATIQGIGALILMNEAGATWFEPMHPGSVHYIPGHTAHRVANIKESPLVFLASWPSDAGHDYQIIRGSGFSSRLVERDGKPVLVANR